VADAVVEFDQGGQHLHQIIARSTASKSARNVTSAARKGLPRRKWGASVQRHCRANHSLREGIVRVGLSRARLRRASDNSSIVQLLLREGRACALPSPMPSGRRRVVAALPVKDASADARVFVPKEVHADYVRVHPLHMAVQFSRTSDSPHPRAEAWPNSVGFQVFRFHRGCPL